MRNLAIISLLVGLTACEVGDEWDYEDEPDQVGQADSAGLVAGQAASPPKSVTTGTCTNTFDFEKVLFIRDVSVVDDATRTSNNGVWTFGHLMTAMAGSRDPKELAKEWLQTWETSPKLGGQVLPGNAGKVDDLMLDPWRADGFALAAAPFRLSAISLRPDTPGGPELRFVFSGVTPAPARAAMPFNVAFEYAVTPAFEKRWYDTLAPLTAGTPAYRDALATLTELGIKDATKLNGSSLKQLRTNEVAIDTPWDLREFRLTATAGATLERAKLTGQPRIEFDGSNKLLNVTPDMETYMAVVPSREFAWKVPGASAPDRFKFAIGTCTGCHSKETNTDFVQIKPREAGQKAEISSFLLSRTCLPGDAECKKLEAKDEFTDPKFKSHRYTTQDDRMAKLNEVLAAAADCGH